MWKLNKKKPKQDKHKEIYASKPHVEPLRDDLKSGQS